MHTAVNSMGISFKAVPSRKAAPTRRKLSPRMSGMRFHTASCRLMADTTSQVVSMAERK